MYLFRAASHLTLGLILGVALLAPGVGRAFEAIDGRLQVHGFYEMQLRGISANWNEQFDMTQWYNVLNIEFELDLAPDGFLPLFDSASAYVRTEVRFDCIWYEGCGMVSSMNTYGNHSRDLPGRLSGARENLSMQGLAIASSTATRFTAPAAQPPGGETTTFEETRVSGQEVLPLGNDPAPLSDFSIFRALTSFSGRDRYTGNPPTLSEFNNQVNPFSLAPFPADMGDTMLLLDDASTFVFPANILEVDVTAVQGKGGGGFGLPVTPLFPWKPKNNPGPPNAVLADRINPFDSSQQSPQAYASAYNQQMYDNLSKFRVTASNLGNCPLVNPPAGCADALDDNGNSWAYGPGDMEAGDPSTYFNNQVTYSLNKQFAAPTPLVIREFQRNITVQQWQETGGGAAGYIAARATANAVRGGGANPMAPIPCKAATGGGRCATTSGLSATSRYAAQGLYLPTKALQDALTSGALKDKDFREVFDRSEIERAFNHGWSQSRTYELKEAYLDLEMFDSRLWLRVGKQNIVWGKTELFRTTDQFNPLDLSLATLPSLEEARIPLLALRAVYSFYDVGPLQDVRIEGAINLDDFQGSDIGSCGEPYAINLVCLVQAGALGHGLTGGAIAGIELPESPWKDISGLEGGVRLEFRYEEFSFAISNYYGYNALPYTKPLAFYDRNVDLDSGRPRVSGATGPCQTLGDPSCLTPGPFDFTDTAANNAYLADPRNALENHPSNQGTYALACATTVGIINIDPSACAGTVFASTRPLAAVSDLYSTAQLIGAALTGGLAANNALAIVGGLPSGDLLPLVVLNRDQNDLANRDFFQPLPGLPAAPCMAEGLLPTDPMVPCGEGGEGFFNGAGTGPANEALGLFLTPEQEALLGCGPLFGTQCDNQGINLFNAEASVLFQSFVSFDGTFESAPCQLGDPGGTCWRTDDDSLAQPGTLNFLTGESGLPVGPGQILGGPVATRYDPSRRRAIVLPGARRTTNPSFNAAVDGCTGPNDQALPPFPANYCQTSNSGAGANLLVHPLLDPVLFPGKTPQYFASELAALSWNFQTILAAFDPNFDATNEGLNSGVCSFVTPQLCQTTVRSFAGLGAGIGSNVTKAAGNGKFGRRSFAWHSGAEAVLAYKKRNVLGFSTDFADDIAKANFAFEFAWVGKQPIADSNSFTGNTDVQDFNLSISIDRPTFIRFLNEYRTFFFNMQLFFQYRDGWEESMPTPGPTNFLFTIAAQTAYWQDRLLPSTILIFDAQSLSGGSISQITYRMSSNFSLNFGVAFYWGPVHYNPMPIAPVLGGNRGGPHAYEDGVYNGLGIVRNRDEVFMRLRYTF